MPLLLMNTLWQPPSPPRTLSRSSSSSLTPLSPLTQTMMSFPQSLSLVDWTMMDQLLYGHLPPPSSCHTLSTFPTTPLCRPVTQRYASPAPLEDPIAQNWTNLDAQPATHTVRSQEGPRTNASVNKRLRTRPESSSTSHWEMRPSTTWGLYIHTLGGWLLDPLYHASSGKTKASARQTKTAVVTKNTTQIPSPFWPWEAQLQQLQTLVGDGQRLTRSKACEMTMHHHPSCRGSSWMSTPTIFPLNWWTTRWGDRSPPNRSSSSSIMTTLTPTAKCLPMAWPL